MVSAAGESTRFRSGYYFARVFMSTWGTACRTPASET